MFESDGNSEAEVEGKPNTSGTLKNVARYIATRKLIFSHLEDF